MAKDKDRAVNPAAAQRKLEKQKALKKGKAQVNAQRTERLASRNPHRLENQISELRAQREANGGKLNTRDQRQLDDLERDIGRVKKARETLGDKAPQFHQQSSHGRRDSDGVGGNERRREGRWRGSGAGNANHTDLGKRKFRSGDDRAWSVSGSSEPETDEDVRRIPWPRDTPPPIPERYARPRNAHMAVEGDEASKPDTTLPTKPPSVPTTAPARKTYEGAPQIRDLKKEATASAFMPAAVKRKLGAAQGKGRLLEEDDVEQLEKQGYLPSKPGATNQKQPAADLNGQNSQLPQQGPDYIHEEEAVARRLKEEEEAFARDIGQEAAGSNAGPTIDTSASRLQATVEEGGDEDD